MFGLLVWRGQSSFGAPVGPWHWPWLCLENRAPQIAQRFASPAVGFSKIRLMLRENRAYFCAAA
jgi:hypothetical protein